MDYGGQKITNRQNRTSEIKTETERETLPWAKQSHKFTQAISYDINNTCYNNMQFSHTQIITNNE